MSKLEKEELSEFVTKAIINDDTRKVAIINQAHLLGCDLVEPYVNAVRQNDLLALALCLNYGVDVNWADDDGFSIAHICAMSGNDVLLKSLISRGLEIDNMTSGGLSPLQIAIYKKKYDCVREFINNGAKLVWMMNSEYQDDILIDNSDDDSDDDSEECLSFDLSMASNDGTGDIDLNNIEDGAVGEMANIEEGAVGEMINKIDDDDYNDDDNNDDIDDIINNINNSDDDEFDEINALTLIFGNPEDVGPITSKKDIKSRNDVIELIVSKLDRLTIVNLSELRKLILQQNIDVVKIILSKFPSAVNNVMGQGFTLLSLLIDRGHVEIVNELIQMKQIDLNPNILRPYLHQLAGKYDIVNIKHLLDKNPDLVYKLCEDSRTAIDHLLLSFEQDREDECVEILNILVSKGCDVNNRNKLGFRTIETAIQYSNGKIIKTLIDEGLNIHEDIIDVNDYFPPIKNNDILAFAAQIGNVEVIDLFLKHDVHINLFQGMPTALLLAIKTNRKNIVAQLMSNDKIKSIVNEPNIKKGLLDYSINKGTGNKKIMLCFSTSEHIDSLKLNSKLTVLNNFEKHFSDKIKNYKKNRQAVLLIIDLNLLFLMKCATIKSIDDIGEIINVWMKLHTFDRIGFYHDTNGVLNEIMMRTMNNRIVYVFNNCMDYIKTIHVSEDNNYIKIIYDELITDRQSYLRDEIKNIKKLQKLVASCQGVDYANERYSLHYTSSCQEETNTKHIEDILIQLMYPIKQPHYESMYNKLIGINCVLSETDKYISVCDYDTNITATVFKLEGSKLPKKWFDFYCYNIGKDTKCDFTHMFPFILDKTIRQIQCHEKEGKDRVKRLGNIHMIYFYGSLCVDNKSILGVFEYFIDSTQTLFHRFFRPYDQLSPKWKQDLVKNIPETFRDKFVLNN